MRVADDWPRRIQPGYTSGIISQSRISFDRSVFGWTALVSLDLSLHRRMRIDCNQSRCGAESHAFRVHLFFFPIYSMLFFTSPLFFLSFPSCGLPPLMTPGGKKREKKKTVVTGSFEGNAEFLQRRFASRAACKLTFRGYGDR